MPSQVHHAKLTAGAYANSLRGGAAKSITPALEAALADGPLSIDELVTATGHGFPLVASAVRSQPKKFVERNGKVGKI